MPHIYGDGSNSTVGTQYNLFKYNKQAVIEATKKQFFGQMSGVLNQPKHFGKTVKKYLYVPILDDRNTNDQGIDAAGAAIVSTTYTFTLGSATAVGANVEASKASWASAYPSGTYVYSEDEWVLTTGATAIAYNATTTGGASGTVTSDANMKVAIEALTSTATVTVTGSALVFSTNVITTADEANADALGAIVYGGQVSQGSGNLYGSSKDIGVISAKMPVLSEEGGRVNRVGMTRLELEGSIENFGIFEEWTRDSMNFDTDDMLMTHLYREAGRAAGELNEDKLAIDLYNGAGTAIYAGGATGLATVAKPCEYDELELMEKTLTENYCPMDTQIITGSRNVDTATVSGARYAHCSIDSRLSLQKMKDPFNEKAWTPARMYAAGGTLATGEKGAIEANRFIEVPEMPTIQGGPTGSDELHPILFIGSGSFTQIGFQSNGKSTKLEIITKKPSKETADRTDPYGKKGFYSINWWSGVLIERSEWIGKILHDPSVAHA